MSKKPKILVTSAAGKTGLPTALQLLEKGYPVRAFVRRDDRRAQRLREAGAAWLNDAVAGLLPETTLTVNNVGWFADNYFMVLESAAQLGIMPMPLGAGAVKKNAPPSNEDIAAVSVAALIDPAAHAGKVYRPTGPELLSPNEIADAMGAALGRRVVYRDISEGMLLKAFKAQGFPDAMQTQLRLYTNEYRRGAFAVNAPTDVVRLVAGRDPETFVTIARRSVAARPEARQTVRNKLRALRNFARILITPQLDPDAFERARDHVLVENAEFASDNAEWRGAHDPAAGFVADRPRGQPSLTADVHDIAARRAAG